MARLDRIPRELSVIRTQPWLSEGSLTCDPYHHSILIARRRNSIIIPGIELNRDTRIIIITFMFYPFYHPRLFTLRNTFTIACQHFTRHNSFCIDFLLVLSITRFSFFV